MRRFFVLPFALIWVVVACPSFAARDLPVDSIRLPPGFRIEVFTDRVPDARSMTLGKKGTLFVGSREAGNVYAVTFSKGANRADRVITLASGLDMPNGVAFRDGSLYVAETSRIIRFDNIEEHLSDERPPVVVSTAFPDRKAHGWKFIAFGPDRLLYVPVGMPCNICEQSDQRFGTIMRMKPDGTNMEVYARGIRNSVGFDWDPETKGLWFTDNGRDWMGDNQPPDELDHAPSPGMNFGFPYCHGTDVPDPKLGKKHGCSEFVPPAMNLGPHVAALGMRFYTGSMFPESYRNQVFIAEHGSWNRSVPIGYRITMATLDGNRKAVSYRVFAEGWLEKGNSWGRPVDVQVMSDGALLVSDDKAGAIYRITYDRPVPSER
jgi:glucose/arabinose dehydrogenase